MCPLPQLYSSWKASPFPSLFPISFPFPFSSPSFSLALPFLLTFPFSFPSLFPTWYSYPSPSRGGGSKELYTPLLNYESFFYRSKKGSKKLRMKFLVTKLRTRILLFPMLAPKIWRCKQSNEFSGPRIRFRKSREQIRWSSQRKRNSPSRR